jgi:S-formylglutathione hydrolase FrmB
VEQTASGYEVAWKITGADQYTVWYTDNSGNYLSSAFDTASGTSAALQSFETSFHQDLNGDGSIGATPDQPHFVYQGADGNGLQLYDVTWNTSGSHPFAVRVLAPEHPSTDYPHSFLFALPVEAGLAQSTYGSGLDELRQLGVPDQYNATIIEPIFPIDSWYADNPVDPAIDFETFTATLLPEWVDNNLATSGTEKNLLIGFSKSGYGGLDLLFKHPSVFDAVAAWDFPADMTAYDSYGSSSSGDYGTDANFQNNYRMTGTFLDAWKAPFTTEDRIWISGSDVFQAQVADFDALLTSHGVAHTLSPQTDDAHTWSGGWLSNAIAGLYGLEQTLTATV